MCTLGIRCRERWRRRGEDRVRLEAPLQLKEPLEVWTVGEPDALMLLGTERVRIAVG
jgi:hypothetical protein